MPPAGAPPSAPWRPCCRTCKPGFSVQFAFLPEGLDPDDLIRQQGAARLPGRPGSATSPLFDVLMKREDEREQPAITPEQRASVEARLNALVAQIGDAGVRRQYESELRETLWEKNRKLVREIDARRWPPRLPASPASGATTPSSTGALRRVREQSGRAQQATPRRQSGNARRAQQRAGRARRRCCRRARSC